jgi:hypothetical protein
MQEGEKLFVVTSNPSHPFIQVTRILRFESSGE